MCLWFDHHHGVLCAVQVPCISTHAAAGVGGVQPLQPAASLTLA
jgi:hypothetical protein